MTHLIHEIALILYNLLAPIILLGIVAVWSIVSALQKKRAMTIDAAENSIDIQNSDSSIQFKKE